MLTRWIRLAVFIAGSLALEGASWTALKNKTPLPLIWPTILLTDGSVMALSSSDYQTWMRLTPDAHGSYVNGTWSLTAKMISSRLDFSSQMLPSGKLWVLGGEYSGTGLGVIPANEGYFAEVFDPVANSWTAAAPFPNINGCVHSIFGGRVSAGSAIVTNILSTAGWQAGWTLVPNQTSIPPGTVIASIDSPSQIHLSNNATASGVVIFSLNDEVTGNTTLGSTTIAGLTATTGILAGFSVSGPGIPAGAVVRSVSANSVVISTAATATATGVALTLKVILPVPSCAGDLISMLVPGPKILTGTLNANSTYLYDPLSDSWTKGPSKIYNDNSSEESWGRLGDGTIVTYDIFQSNTKGAGYAERYDPVANKWTSISPADGTAKGLLPVLSGPSVDYELGPLLRLQDDRVFAIGGNGHTALYTPSTNTWAAGPDMLGVLGGQPFLFAADDAAAAVLPNGHVLLAGDAGNGITSSGTTTQGSAIISAIPDTRQLQTGWTVAGNGISTSATIKSIDSPSQITMTANATSPAVAVNIHFGSVFSNPVQLFDFDPVANVISPVSPALNATSLNTDRAYYTQMLMLPTGQVLFSDATSQLYVYTPDGDAPASLLPTVKSIAAKGDSAFTLTGTQLTGQSAGAAYGDDEQYDSNYPIVSLTNAAGSVFYCRSFNWSYIGVGGGTLPQTVDFTLHPGVTAGDYALVVSGAGLRSQQVLVRISSDLHSIDLQPAGTPPTVSAVAPVGGSRGSVAQGQFIAIYGQNLASSTRTWGASDFPGGTSPGSPLPTVLDGVRVTIGGQPAAVYFVSSSQLDVLIPSGLPAGAANVVVTNGLLASAPFSINIAAASPVFFSYAAGSNLYPSAVHLNGTLVGDSSLVPTAAPAHPGEIISFFVSGLAAAPGGAVAAPAPFTQPVTLTAGSNNLTVLAAALVATGEYQINAQLPAGIAAGTYPLTLTVAGASTADAGVTVVLPVAN
jgi:uncharacterized protein (TIGR03437 family)